MSQVLEARKLGLNLNDIACKITRSDSKMVYKGNEASVFFGTLGLGSTDRSRKIP